MPRWPSTASPYLLVNHRSANGTGPVSTSYFAASALRGTAVTLEGLRVDRQLQEALAAGPDPTTRSWKGASRGPRSRRTACASLWAVLDIFFSRGIRRVWAAIKRNSRRAG